MTKYIIVKLFILSDLHRIQLYFVNIGKNINDAPLWSLGSMSYDGGETAETDISANHDKYIYENINIR